MCCGATEPSGWVINVNGSGRHMRHCVAAFCMLFINLTTRWSPCINVGLRILQVWCLKILTRCLIWSHLFDFVLLPATFMWFLFIFVPGNSTTYVSRHVSRAEGAGVSFLHLTIKCVKWASCVLERHNLARFCFVHCR